MPRPQNALGRPGTRVIPTNWGAAHAPVVDGTFTAKCRIWPGEANAAPAVWDEEAGSPVRPDPEHIYEGGCRIQVVNQRLALKLIGDQAAKHMTYLVVIERDTKVPTGAVVEITESTDSLLPPGHRLSVGDVIRGSTTFERDLICVDDLTQTGQEG